MKAIRLSDVPWTGVLFTRSKPLNIAGFGEDTRGELYILAFDGKIHRLARP